MPDPIHTERLLLRPFTIDDAADYWPLVALPEVLRYTGEQPLATIDAVRELLQSRPLRDYAVHGYGRLACIEKTSGRLIGFSGLKYLEDLQQVDIGYRFLPDCWGQGYASESAAAVMAHGKIVLGLDRIIGMVMPDNQASARVLTKLGLSLEGKIKLETWPLELDLYAWERNAVGT